MKRLQPTDGVPLVAVRKTADVGLLPILESVLRAAGIPCVVQGGRALGLFPLGPTAFGLMKNSMEASILVPEERAAEARALLDSFDAPDPA